MRPSIRSIGFAVVLALLAAGALAAEAPNPRQLQYPALPAFDIPQPTVFTLKNGLTVLLMEDRELPLIEADFRIRTGTHYDPAGKTGLASLVGQMLREGGTTRRSADQVDDFLAARAAEIETGMSGDVGYATMNSLKGDFDEVFALFVEILRQPAFAEARLAVAQAQARAGIARRNDSIAGVTQREFQRLIYGADSPLARVPEHATIAAVTRDDLLAFHKEFYHPNNMYLGIVGDFETQAMRAKLERALADWPKGAAFKRARATYDESSTPGVFFVEMPNVTQAYVRLGHLGIRVGDPDYFAAQVMNEVLGGSFASRLFSNVRSTKGLAYSVSGSLGASYAYPGVFQVGLSTKSGTMAESVEALKEEVRGIIERPPSAEELARAKASILNSFVFNFDSRAEVLGQQMTYAYHGLPADFLERYRANIEKVTAADVSRVARERVHPDKLKLLVVGTSADFGRPVSTFGSVRTIDITIPAPPALPPASGSGAGGS